MADTVRVHGPGVREQLWEALETLRASQLDAVAAHDAQEAGRAVLVDTRRTQSWDHGHIAGAVHLPDTSTDDDIRSALTGDRIAVAYGWGPGCDGELEMTIRLLRAGYDARILVGGYEYWARNGFTVIEHGVPARHDPDPLVATASAP